jgi:prevent-host-death family protein
MFMGQPIRVRNARGEFVDAKEVSASEAKNVGRILEFVSRDGGVTITRRNEPFAVVIPVEAYARLVATDEASLGSLAAEFDALLDRMQQPGMASAMERAFRMSPAELGGAAVQQATGEKRVDVKGASARPARRSRGRG